MRRKPKRVPFVTPLEPRVLFAYDIQAISASVERGTYSPGQPVSVTVSFRNAGDTDSPAVEQGFSFFFVNQGFDTDTSTGSTYGAILDNTSGYQLPAIGAGVTVQLTVSGNLSPASYNGGPYGIYLYAYGGNDNTNFLINDANPADNFLITQPQGFFVTGAIDPVTGGIPPFSTPSPVVGSLDTAFGDNNSGVSTSTFTGTPLQTLSTVFDPVNNLQYALAQQGNDLALTRFLNTGELDTSYDGDGVLTVSVGTPVKAASLVRLSGGQLLIGASRADGTGAVIVRTDSSGALDPAFGTNGVVQVPTTSAFGTNAAGFTANSLAAGTDGSVFLAGSISEAASTNRDIAVLKLNPDGTPATGFGGSAGGGLRVDLQSKVGKTLTSHDDTARAVVVDSKGRIALAGSSGNRAVAIRLKLDGSRDTTFGVKGLYTAIVNPATASSDVSEQFTTVTLGAKDYLLLGGYSALGATAGGAPATSTQAFVAQTTDRGAPLASFGTRGPRGSTAGIARLSNVSSAFALPNTLIAGPDGGVLVSLQIANSLAAVASGAVGAALARLDPAGKPVTNFGTNGVSIVLPISATPFAATDTQTAFNDFINARDGASAPVGNGRVRTLSSDVPTDSTTNLRIAQVIADGVDVAPLFDGTLPATVVSGTRRTVRMKIANLGTLPANGSATVMLDMIPATGGTAIANSSRVLRLKLKSGLLLKNSMTLTVPKAASGLYTLVLRVQNPSGFTDIATSNDAVRSPTQFTAAPRGRQAVFSLGTLQVLPPESPAPSTLLTTHISVTPLLRRQDLFSKEDISPLA